MTFTEILSDARRLTKTNSTRFTTSDITDSANRALEHVTHLIREAQGRWQWDDSNNTDFAIATTNLVTTLGSEQQDYGLDSTNYRMERVEVKDSDGNWHKLAPIDEADIYDQSLTDFLKTAGLPLYYDKVGNSLFLYPKPLDTAVTATAGLKVFYERGPSYFTTSDTTKTPGFNPLFHRLLPLWCAYDYAFINNLKNANSFRNEIVLMEQELKDYYSLRDRDERIKISAKRIKYN